MARKQVTALSSLLRTTQDLFNSTVAGEKNYIPNIVEFCESSAYLGLAGLNPPIHLYPIQKLVLKCFYRGTPGNENLTLSEEELELIRLYELNGNKNGNIWEKWNSGELFRELVLVWGRRSGKDFTIAIIALYEAMKLLESDGGNPYSIYNLGSANPFTILTIANSSTQAHVLYNEIREKFSLAPYFKGKYLAEGITADSIFLLTPHDKKMNEEFAAKGLPPKLGSILIRAGHSNSDSLLGIGCYVLLLDEVASFKTTAGASSGERIYTALTPTIKTYARRVPSLDENGNQKMGEDGKPATKTVYDGKIVSISSPRGMDGVFFNLYNDAHKINYRLMCRLPTWAVNIHQDQTSLRNSEPQMTEERFMMEYGAEFSGTAGENFFPPDYVERCFSAPYVSRDLGVPGIVYYAHLDPAKSSHNYALAVIHKEFFLNHETKKVDFNIVLDHMKFWSPKDGKPIQMSEVDEYMLFLNRRFHLGLVTYDQWNSQSSIERLRKAGIPAQCTVFSKSYKIQIYDELYALVAAGKLKVPPSLSTKLLKDEMLNLQRRFMAQGYRIYPKSEGECRTDDCCDALAGACFNALKTEANRLPQSRLVNTGYSPMGNTTIWRSMSGVLGQGSGGQVANNLEQRSNAYPRR